MEQILVKRSDNVDYLLEDRNKGVFVSSIIQSTELRSNDVINVELSSREFINFTIGDSFHYLGQKYTLNQIPRYFKNSSNDFQFSITFEGVMFDLRRASYDVNIDTTGSAIYGETLTADLELFATILIENINRVFPGKWVLGEIPAETETKTITFSEEENCLAALQMLCDEYDTDFIIKTDNNGVNILNFKQIGEEISLEFKVGFQKGLYTLTREKVDASDIVTRLKVYGSDKNLGTDYRANRLVLKDKNKPNSYIENTQAVAKYGIYESTKIFDDIYPRRKGKVTSINSDSVYKFSDSSMDFDLKEKDENGTKYLLNGVNAKIHFNTGDLAGYELEIHDYNHETKEFHIVKFADENGYEFPSKDSDAFRIGIGDEYVILDIQMPQTYIDNAEAELFDKADEYLSDKLEPNIQYLLDVDTLHLQRILNDTVTQFFLIGDFIKVIDEDFDINRYIRIKSIERDLKNPFDYKLTLSDSKVTNFLSGTIPGEINTIKNIIKLNNLNDPAKARRNWKDAQEVLNMVFDVEGDYYTDKIKPNSIETTHLQVGAKSMQFNLIDSFFEPNFEGNPNKIRWSTCKLVHFAISDKIVDWQIQGGLKDLEANKPYYLYAKCNKSNNIGVIEITETQYVVDQGNFYYFLIGIINSYSEDVKAREISLMYGFTTVSGRFIKTGRIESSGGGTYFDLDTGEISGKITFTSDSPAFNQVKDSIQIGGRNLILNSKDQRNVFRAEMYPESYIYYDISNGKLEPNTEYILTWEYLTSGNFKPSMAYFVSDVGEHRSISGIEATYNTWVKKEWKFTTLSNPDQQGAIRFDHKGTIDGQNCLLAVRMVKLEKGNKATDWTPAPEDVDSAINDVKVKAEQALTQLTSIANDNILSPSEKQQVSNEWNRIKSEYTSNYALAINNGISTTDYMNSYNDLYNYITPLLVSLSIDSPIVGDVFRTKFKAYYDQNITLVVAVNDKLRLGVTANTSAISQVNATIERINKITSFLGTTVDNNVVATGVALVGQGTTGTGGLSGIRDNGDDSIFLFAGADFNNRYRARWIMSHGGFERGYHSNGILGFERGYDGSKWIFNMYNESGAPLFQLDSVRGLVPVNYTSESWSRVTLLKTNIVTRDYNTVQSSLRSFIESNVSVSSVRHNPDEYFNYMYWVYSYSYNNIYVCWDYYNGTHPNNAQYANYVGYKVTSDSRTNNITDGWYFRAMDGVFSIRDSPNGSQTFELYATVYYIQNGKIVETQNLNYIK